MDSNHDKGLQRALCYRYTIGQRPCKLTFSNTTANPKIPAMRKSTGNPAPPAFGVAILVAGRASRVGRPKLLLPWGDTTVIGHLARQWRDLGARQIAVVCRPDDHPLETELNRLQPPQLSRIPNLHPERGMFHSIRCAASWEGWQKDLTAWVIALGDQPHLPASTLQTLLDFHRSHARAICQPSYGGRGRHPVILPRNALAALKETRASTLKDFLQGTSIDVLECLVDDFRLTLDLDTPEDYKKLISLDQTIGK